MKLLPVALVAVLGAASSAQAGQIALSFQDGYVSLSVKDASVREVLSEWARRGQTRIVNGEKLASGLVSLELVHVPEKQALEVLLRAAAGYMAAPRRTTLAANLSSFDRIVVMPTSSAAPPPSAAGLRTPMPQPQPQGPMGQPQPPNAFQGPMPGQVDDQDEPVSPPFPVNNDGSIDPNAQQPGPPFGPMPGQPDPRNQERPVNPADPNAQPPAAPPPPGPTPNAPGILTTPTPGQLPAPAQKPPQ